MSSTSGMAASNKTQLVLILLWIGLSACEPTADKYEWKKISLATVYDVKIDQKTHELTDHFVNWNDTNKYALIHIQFEQRTFICSKRHQHGTKNISGYRGSTEFLQEISINNKSNFLTDSLIQEFVGLQNYNNPRSYFHTYDYLLKSHELAYQLEDGYAFDHSTINVIVIKDSIRPFFKDNKTPWIRVKTSKKNLISPFK